VEHIKCNYSSNILHCVHHLLYRYWLLSAIFTRFSPHVLKIPRRWLKVTNIGYNKCWTQCQPTFCHTFKRRLHVSPRSNVKSSTIEWKFTFSLWNSACRDGTTSEAPCTCHV
jgi:hypothetical protein